MIGVIYFLFGLVVGSFLNVLIYRLPRELPFVKETSMCPACSHRLYPRDLVPLFSWLLLRRRCRYCEAPISWRYPAVELTNALLWLACFLAWGPTVQAGAYCAVVSSLLVVLLVDWEHQIIPDSMHLCILAAGILLAVTGPSALPLSERLIGLFAISVPFFGIVFFSGGRAMGAGDIKLMAAIGFCLGWKQACLITLVGSIGGSLAVLLLLGLKKPLGRQVPFGSFLAAGAVLCLFWGEPVIQWYMSLCGL